MVRKPWAWAAGACSRGFAGAGRRGTGTRTVSRIRTVSTEGARSVERGAVCSRPRIRYPPTPAATTTSPMTTGARERRWRAFAAGSGVVGAPVISVGASAVPGAGSRRAPRPGRRGDRLLRPDGGGEVLHRGEALIGFLHQGPRDGHRE